MALSVGAATLPELAALREHYRAEMNCQFIHDFTHSREGWTLEYVIDDADESIGYGSVAVEGPWTETPTLYEFYVTVPHRVRLFECFDALMHIVRSARSKHRRMIRCSACYCMSTAKTFASSPCCSRMQ